MLVDAILKLKGSKVITIGPDSTVQAASLVMTNNKIGSVVVCDDQDKPVGVLCERDIIHGLARRGIGLLGAPVRSQMKSEFIHCDRKATAKQLMRIMTEHYIRHIPVLEQGGLQGIVRIGDVVKYHLNETEMEINALRDRVGVAPDYVKTQF